MFEYEFVRHEVSHRRGGIDDQAYQKVIVEYARAGWRLVQVLVEQPAAMVGTYVLIFGRTVEQQTLP